MFLRQFKWILPSLVLITMAFRLVFLPTPTSAIEDTAYVSLSVDKPLAVVGEMLLYTLTISNPQDNPLSEIVIQQSLDPRLENIQVTAAGQPILEGSNLVISGLALQPSESVTITIAAQISSRATPGDVLSNVAHLESPQASVHTSNVVEVMVLPTTLPATGESPWWRVPILGMLIAAWLILVTIGMDVRRRRRAIPRF